LKVVTAGAGALVSVACSSSGGEGSLPYTPPDAGDAGFEAATMGFVDSGGFYPDGPVGAVTNPEAGNDAGAMGLVDGSPADVVDGGGPVGFFDGGPMGALDGPVGAVANPEAGSD
jgi:hypothetical protein